MLEKKSKKTPILEDRVVEGCTWWLGSGEVKLSRPRLRIDHFTQRESQCLKSKLNLD